MVGTYWIKQNDSMMAISYFEKVCDYGDTGGCAVLGNLKLQNQQAEQSAVTQKQVNEHNAVIDNSRKKKNLINGLQMLNGFVNSGSEQQRQPTTNCETKPVYGMDGKLIKYRTDCK